MARKMVKNWWNCRRTQWGRYFFSSSGSNLKVNNLPCETPALYLLICERLLEAACLRHKTQALSTLCLHHEITPQRRETRVNEEFCLKYSEKIVYVGWKITTRGFFQEHRCFLVKLGNRQTSSLVLTISNNLIKLCFLWTYLLLAFFIFIAFLNVRWKYLLWFLF